MGLARLHSPSERDRKTPRNEADDRAAQDHRSRHRRRDARDRQRARKAARVLALAPTAQKDKALPPSPRRSARARPKSSPPMPRTWPRPSAAAPMRPSSTASRSTTSASRRWPTGVEVIRDLADPVGKVTESWTRPERHDDRARARAARRRRHHLREPPERHRRCRARCASKPAMPRSCAAARRATRSNRAIHDAIADGPGIGRLAGGRDPAGADPRPRRGRDDARRPRRHHRRDRAARRQEPGRARAGRKRACRCSRISKASATSMSTRPPRSTWRSRSCSTPRCAAPASAAPPRRCWSIAPSRRRISSRW